MSCSCSATVAVEISKRVLSAKANATMVDA